MSISLSLYDVFSNIVPGLIYLFAINELLRAFGKSQVDLLQASTSGQTLLIILIAFILGHLFTTFTYEGWYRLLIKPHEDKFALEKTSSRFPELEINFRPSHTELLLSIIQLRDKVAQVYRNMANQIECQIAALEDARANFGRRLREW
jgi:hypothetical protein